MLVCVLYVLLATLIQMIYLTRLVLSEFFVLFISQNPLFMKYKLTVITGKISKQVNVHLFKIMRTSIKLVIHMYATNDNYQTLI